MHSKMFVVVSFKIKTPLPHRRPPNPSQTLRRQIPTQPNPQHLPRHLVLLPRIQTRKLPIPNLRHQNRQP